MDFKDFWKESGKSNFLEFRDTFLMRIFFFEIAKKRIIQIIMMKGEFFSFRVWKFFFGFFSNFQISFFILFILKRFLYVQKNENAITKKLKIKREDDIESF